VSESYLRDAGGQLECGRFDEGHRGNRGRGFEAHYVNVLSEVVALPESAYAAECDREALGAIRRRGERIAHEGGVENAVEKERVGLDR